MDTVSIVVGILIGGVVWYGIFYVRYGQKSLVDDLRSSVKEQQSRINELEHDYREYREQNVILREKTAATLRANEDLTRIVSELSRYYYHIKVWSEKIQELASFLRLPDPTIEDKIEYYVPEAVAKTPERDIPVYEKEEREEFF